MLRTPAARSRRATERDHTMPTVTINIPDSWTTKVRGREVFIEAAKFTDLTGYAKRMFEYSAENRWLNDRAAHGLGPAPKAKDYGTEKEFEAAVKAFADACLANAMEDLKNAYAGVYDKERGTREPTDPLAAEAKKIARGIVRDNFGRMVKNEWKVTPDQMAKARAFAAHHTLDLSDGEKFVESAIEIISKLPRTVESAKRNVAEAAQLAADLMPTYEAS